MARYLPEEGKANNYETKYDMDLWVVAIVFMREI